MPGSFLGSIFAGKIQEIDMLSDMEAPCGLMKQLSGRIGVFFF